MRILTGSALSLLLLAGQALQAQDSSSEGGHSEHAVSAAAEDIVARLSQ